MTTDLDEEFPMDEALEHTPNILVVEESPIGRHLWRSLNSPSRGINIKAYASMNVAMIEWLNLYSYDHIPRVLIFGWEQRAESLGCLTKQSATGTSYNIDGVAFALHCCMSSVEDGEGLFIAYSTDISRVHCDVSHWPENMRSNLHIIKRVDRSPVDLLEWVVHQPQFPATQLHTKIV